MLLKLNPQVARLIGTAINYNSEILEEVIKLSLKMTSLAFIAYFNKCEEGPILRTYYFTPDSNATLSTLLSKDEDLALALAVDSVMVSREKGFITIAVPRKDKVLIKFDECLYHFNTDKTLREQYILPLLMGKDHKGNLLFMDLTIQPHLLISGTTGGGKSIFIAQILCSLALKYNPLELEFILADTKQLDLVLFRELNHVKAILTDIHDIRRTLEDLIAEIRLRTSIMSGLARNIQEYNALEPSKKGTEKGKDYKFKYKVLIVDEFADVVLSDREWLKTLPTKERPPAIETLIQRIAQISRAAGIHIILATQRPSIKVINGDIKANFPARISFKLSSMQDSRVILDENGAEKLLGKGDYLYKINGSEVVKRAHSAYVDMRDITMIMAQHERLREQFSNSC